MDPVVTSFPNSHAFKEVAIGNRQQILVHV